MANNDDQIGKLQKKYGARGVDNAARLHPRDFAKEMSWRDEMDPHYTRLCLDFTYGVLDDKTRILCVVGVCTALDELVQGENHIRAALMLGATPREVQEVAVQSTQYWGMPRSLRAMAALERVLKEQGRTAELIDKQLPLPA